LRTVEDARSHFDELVPSWLFALRRTRWRVLAAAVTTAATTAPLWLSDDAQTMRLGPLLVLGLVVVAALTGSVMTALCASVVVPWYWYANVPPADAFALSTTGDAVSVAAMAIIALGLVVLTRSMERSVAAVRQLDEHRRLEQLAASFGRLDAVHEAEQVRSILELSNKLAVARDMAAVAETMLHGLDVPSPPTSASIAIVEHGRLRMLAARNADSRSLEVLEQVDLVDTPWLSNVLAGSPAFVDDHDAFAAEHPRAGVLRLYRTGSWAAIPFRAEGTVGLLSVHYAQAQQLSAHEVYFSLAAEILATALQRAASDQARDAHLGHLERTLTELAQTLAERDRIARTLSTTLLPPRLPQLPGFTSAGWLIPASADEVSGDFYDLFALTTGGWVAVLGDVCGKGAEAAAVTSLARYATRISALDDPDPARIADVANEALRLDPSDLFCTMALVRYVADADRIDVALAGHPQPRLVVDGTVTRLGAFGPALGLGSRAHPISSHALAPGATLVLFSDGLIERNRSFGEAELDEQLAELAGGTAQETAARIRDLVLAIPEERQDDLTVLVICREAAAT
jgi:serine phosphatase RsbU (regulator of sigma subunit)